MTKVGDYKLDTVLLHAPNGTIDIKALILELNVYESISKTTMYGNIVVADTANHIQNMPIVGQEELEFVLSTDNDQEKIDFQTSRARIYKVTDQIRTGIVQQVYTLHFTSHETMINERSRVKSAYSGSGDQIVPLVMTNLLKTNKTTYVEKSDLYMKVLGNNMRPFTFLNMVASRSRSSQFNSAGYLFYENHRGFQFSSWERHAHISPDEERKPREFFRVQPSERDTSVNDEMGSITEYKIMKNQDVLAAYRSGLINASHLVHDIHTKETRQISHSYKDWHADQKHIESNMLFTDTDEEQGWKSLWDYPEASLSYATDDTKLYGRADAYRTNHQSVSLNAIANLLAHEQLVAKVVIPGNSNIAAGDIVHLRLPNYEPVDTRSDQIHDKYLSGRWLTTNVVHTVNGSNGTYFTTFDCVRDGLPEAYMANATPIINNVTKKATTITL